MTDRRELPADLRSLGAAYNRSRWERALADQLHAAGLPPYERELEFAKAAMGRRWRFDFAWPAEKLAVEVQGAVWTSGRHSRGAGYTADCEKFANAAILGWRVMPVTPNQIRRGEALAWIAAALESKTTDFGKSPVADRPECSEFAREGGKTARETRGSCRAIPNGGKVPPDANAGHSPKWGTRG